MSTEKVYHSMQELEEAFFPKEARQRKLDRMTNEQRTKFLAEEMADEIIAKVRQSLGLKEDE